MAQKLVEITSLKLVSKEAAAGWTNRREFTRRRTHKGLPAWGVMKQDSILP